MIFLSRDYTNVAPPHSFIHTDEFPTFDDLANHLIYLSQNPSAYTEYLWWHDLYNVQIFNHFYNRKNEVLENIPEHLNPFCRLCRIVNQEKGFGKAIPNFGQFWSNNKCAQPTDVNKT